MSRVHYWRLVDVDLAAEHVCLAVQSGVNKSLTEPGAGLWGLVLLAFALVISWSCG